MKYNFESQYEHIGYLFYGLVCRNGRISASDLLRLNEFIDNNWKSGITGDLTLSTHLIDSIHRGIRYASINSMNSSHAIESFKNYYSIHALGFSVALRERIATSVAGIIKEFARNIEAAPFEAELRRMLNAPPARTSSFSSPEI